MQVCGSICLYTLSHICSVLFFNKEREEVLGSELFYRCYTKHLITLSYLQCTYLNNVLTVPSTFGFPFGKAHVV